VELLLPQASIKTSEVVTRAMGPLRMAAMETRVGILKNHGSSGPGDDSSEMR
jgi:hypothetical protein